jgi:hypothetical protein
MVGSFTADVDLRRCSQYSGVRISALLQKLHGCKALGRESAQWIVTLIGTEILQIEFFTFFERLDVFAY